MVIISSEGGKAINKKTREKMTCENFYTANGLFNMPLNHS